MPIRPIDMQTMLPRIQKQHNAKEVVVHKEQNAQHNNQMRNQEVTQKKLKQVQKNEQKEQESQRVKDKNKEERETSSKKKKKKKKLVSKDKKKKGESDKDEKTEKPYLRRSHFDMKI